MIWPFRKADNRKPSPEAGLLLDELNKILERAPRDIRKSAEKMGPYAKEGPTVDPLQEAGVYLAYGHIGSAADTLRRALSDPARVAELGWLPNGEEYARGVLARLDRLHECGTKL